MAKRRSIVRGMVRNRKFSDLRRGDRVTVTTPSGGSAFGTVMGLVGRGMARIKVRGGGTSVFKSSEFSWRTAEVGKRKGARASSGKGSTGGG